jgi:hypothetical protein
MDMDWVGDCEISPEKMYDDAVIPVEEIVSDCKVFLNTQTLDGQSIISLSVDGRFSGKTLFAPKEIFTLVGA